VIVDVRLKPYSRQKEFGRWALQKVLGVRYVWVEAFGNLAYNDPTGAVRLKDEEEGLRRLTPMLARDSRKVVLLCACWNAMECHRENVAVLLHERLGVDSVRLRKADVQPDVPPPEPRVRDLPGQLELL
jgi:uncharacterized protein (DUF488 family)